jgi:pyruvate/2-oxoglutarate/acetoin dehydrogenase E1 component
MSTPPDPEVNPTEFVSMTALDAIRDAIRVSMLGDDRVIVLGEDIAGGAGQGQPLEGAMGGTFGVTKGLLEEFGSRRVRDTPISEAGIASAAVGAAMAGLRPIVDLMWASFAPSCFDQIVNQAAKLRFMSGGQATIPLVLRMAAGAGLRAAAQHSDTLYPVFAHIPGLKVAVPADAAEARGLLLEAISIDSPVIFLEHMSLYRQSAMVPVAPTPMPFGQVGVIRQGSDVSIVGVGYACTAALEAAELLIAEGIDAQVVSLRTLQPLDIHGIDDLVASTGRLVVVEESPPSCSVASEIAASIGARRFGRLHAPIARVNCAHTPVPFSPVLEDAYLPSAIRVAEACRSVMRHSSG